MKTFSMGAKVLLLTAPVFAYQPGFGPGKQWGMAAGDGLVPKLHWTAGTFDFICSVDIGGMNRANQPDLRKLMGVFATTPSRSSI